MPAPAADHRRATAARNVTAIVDAAERLLRGEGAPTRGGGRPSLSIAAVAAESGLSRVTVYAHFATLPELVEAVVARALEQADAALAVADLDDGPPLDALARALATGWRELDRQHGVAQAAAEQLGPERMRRAHGHVLAAFGRLLDRGRAAGVVRDDLPRDWLATALLALVHAAGDEVRAGRLDADAALAALQASARGLVVPPR